MPKKSEFKSSKVQWRKKNSGSSYKKNSLVFCSIILLICSICVWFVDTFVQWMKDLFLAYTNLQQQTQKSELENRGLKVQKNVFVNLKIFSKQPLQLSILDFLLQIL